VADVLQLELHPLAKFGSEAAQRPVPGEGALDPRLRQILERAAAVARRLRPFDHGFVGIGGDHGQLKGRPILHNTEAPPDRKRVGFFA
jgi:hypothetical protein